MKNANMENKDAEYRQEGKQAAEVLFNYIGDALYHPSKADLNLDSLPEDFKDLGKGLTYFVQCVIEATNFAKDLSRGDLDKAFVSHGNEIAVSLKSLQANLRHLVWKAKQVANGDYRQRIDFMGDFAEAFNAMAEQLENRRRIYTDETSKLQNYIELILTNSPDIITLFDPNGKTVLTSESYLNLCNISDSLQLNEKTFYDLMDGTLSEDSFLQITKMFDFALNNNTASKSSFYIDFAKSGNFSYYSVQINPMFDEAGNSKGVMVIFHDTTAINKAHLEAERARELAEKSERIKSDFLSRMSHEMFTPINAIRGMTTVARSEKNCERKVYCLDKIDEASLNLFEIINDMLTISDIESGDFKLSKDTFNLKNALKSICENLKSESSLKNQIFEFFIDENISDCIISDERRLCKVFGHIVSNAIKFTPEKGYISVNVSLTFENEKKAGIHFIVKDTGIGISDQDKKGLFVPFGQADGSISRKAGGTGLGLAISKHIIKMMGGDIVLESEPEKGSCFSFDIIVDIPVKDTNISENNETFEGIFSGKRFLLADDVDINREILALLLEDTGALLEFAVDGAQTVEKFKKNSYDLILMDIHMPGLSGYDASNEIRSLEANQNQSTPIIAITADMFSETFEKCKKSGINDCVRKPIDINELISKIKKYICPKTIN